MLRLSMLLLLWCLCGMFLESIAMWCQQSLSDLAKTRVTGVVQRWLTSTPVTDRQPAVHRLAAREERGRASVFSAGQRAPPASSCRRARVKTDRFPNPEEPLGLSLRTFVENRKPGMFH